jgi:hypothetical protein
MKRLVLIALLLLAAAYLAYGASSRRARAARLSAPGAAAGAAPDVRGAFHVHTTASDGRGSLAEVARAAREAGLRFLVVTDHNLRTPDRPEYLDGVLVVPATEASTRYGHVVALGTPRPLTRAERDGDPLGAIRALGGQAILAHPLHPRRPFSGWGTGPWRGFEIVSNDTAWHRVVADRDVARVISAALLLPWDPPGAVLRLADDPADELARFDAELGKAGGGRGAPARVLLCSADAHGYPGYRAAFEAFSMHVPVALTGDAARDAAAVTAALLDGTAACVLDGRAPADHVRLSTRVDGALDLALRAPPVPGERGYRLLHDGAPLGRFEAAPGGGVFRCEGRCPPGAYRAEVRIDGQPWIFTNPVGIE